jgi:hypothetical protein
MIEGIYNRSVVEPDPLWDFHKRELLIQSESMRKEL